MADTVDCDCDEFKPNNWKPELCVNCQRHEAEHAYQKSIHGTTMQRNTDLASSKPLTQIKRIPRPQEPPPSPSPSVKALAASPNTANKPHATKPTTLKKPSTASKPQIGVSRRLTTSQPANTESKPFSEAVKRKTQSLPQGSKLPITTSIARRVTARPADAQTGLVKILTIHAENTQPLDLKKKSDLTRVPSISPKPKPKITTTKPVARASSLTLPNKPSVKAKKAAIQAKVEKIEELVIEKKPVYQNTLPQNTVNTPTENTENHTIDMSDKHHHFHAQLSTVDLHPDSLHEDDYNALISAYTSFQNYKDYKEVLHESPFHKLAEKVKYHHRKHMHISPTHENHPKYKSYVSHESFYGSVDVTNYSSPQQAIGSSLRDGQYDNAMPTATSDLIASPKYDPVPAMMTSQDSEQSDRIYAEVEESMITSTLNAEVGLQASAIAMEASQYDLVSLPTTPLSTTQPPLITVDRSSTAAYHDSWRVDKEKTGKQTGTMSFLRTFLKKGSKARSPEDGAHAEITLQHVVIEPEDQTANKQDYCDQWIKSQRQRSEIVKSKKIKSPNNTLRPDNKPPPPPSDQKQKKMSTSTLNSPTSETNKMALVQEKKGDFVLSQKDAELYKTGTESNLYDAPWDDSESIIQNLMAARSKSNIMSQQKQLKLPSYYGSKTHLNQPTKQFLVPNGLGSDLRKRDPRVLRSGKASQSSPATADKTAHDSGYESATLSSTNRQPTPTPSKNDSKGIRGDSSRASRPASPPMRMTPIDSIQLCFDHLTTMNLGSLQNVGRQFQQRQADLLFQPHRDKFDMVEIDVLDENPVHYNNKVVFYKARWLVDDSPLVLMLTLKRPKRVKTYSAYSLPISQCYYVKVNPKLVPDCMIKSNMNSPTDPKEDNDSLSESKLAEENNNTDKPGDLESKLGNNTSEQSSDIKEEDLTEKHDGESAEKCGPEHETNIIVTSDPDTLEPAIFTLSFKIAENEKNKTAEITSDGLRSETNSKDLTPADKNLGIYDQPWHGMHESDRKNLEESYKAGLLNREKAKELMDEKIVAYATILPNFPSIISLQQYLDKQEARRTNTEEFELDALFCFLQIIQMIFSLMERQLQPDIISLTDLIVMLDSDGVPTVCSHMVNLKPQSKTAEIKIICEKIRMFIIQILHMYEKIGHSLIFEQVEDMVREANDVGDLKTIALILQYILWGPSEDEVKVMMLAENRKQAFELWLQLARAKLLNGFLFQKMEKHKTYMMAQFLTTTTGAEIYRITKILNALKTSEP